jgi:triosephosphate isomerase
MAQDTKDKKKMPQKIIAGNWKMHGTKASVVELVSALRTGLEDSSSLAQVIVFAPTVFIPLLEAEFGNSDIAYGAQTVSEYNEGAYTGEIAASMLKDFECRYVLVGHSERRALFVATNEKVAEKFVQAQKYDLTPILCVGETLKQREANETLAIIEKQLKAVIDKAGIAAFRNAVIAYEPVWAIGTGETASPEQAQGVHAAIRAFLAGFDADVATNVSLLYGGSVKPDNATGLFAMVDIDGALVGGASLDAEKFIGIVNVI